MTIPYKLIILVATDFLLIYTYLLFFTSMCTSARTMKKIWYVAIGYFIIGKNMLNLLVIGESRKTYIVETFIVCVVIMIVLTKCTLKDMMLTGVLLVIQYAVFLAMSMVLIYLPVKVSPDLHLLYEIVGCKMFSFYLVIFVQIMRNKVYALQIKRMKLLMVTFIPIVGIVFNFFLLLFLHYSNILRVVQIVFIIIYSILTNNVSNDLMSYYFLTHQIKTLQKKNEYFQKQLHMMNMNEKNIRIISHDLKNHIITMDTLLKEQKYEQVKEYLSEFDKQLNDYTLISRSGNTVIDSIVNYKVNEAMQKNIMVELDINIPAELEFSFYDISIIIGNLMDNAICASSKIEKDRKISLSIKYDRNMLFIHITNTFDGIIICKKGRIRTRNVNKENHGYGLLSVKKVAEKYKGYVRTEYNSTMFMADVILYYIKEEDKSIQNIHNL